MTGEAAHRRVQIGPVGYARSTLFQLRAGFLREALTDGERCRMSIELYDAAFRPAQAEAGLHPWEESWLRRELPTAPARVLVGAAGTGREALVLAKWGYRVDAFEPAKRPASHCATALSGAARVVRGCFDDLIATVLEGASTPLSEFGSQHYDAVLLGWGGLSHVLRREQRTRLLRACDRLAPWGPILASFFMDPHAAGRQACGRAAALGRVLGSWVSRMRPAASPAAELEFTTWGGFLYHFGAEEIHELACAAGRTLVWQHEGGFPHATFRPRAR